MGPDTSVDTGFAFETNLSVVGEATVDRPTDSAPFCRFLEGERGLSWRVIRGSGRGLIGVSELIPLDHEAAVTVLIDGRR